MIGLAFALEHEAAGLLPELQGADRFLVRDLICHTGTLHGQPVVVAIVGMGAATAGRRAAVLAEHFALEVVVLAGYAGALTPGLKRNTPVLAANYLSPAAEPWAARLGPVARAALHSAAEVAGTPEARRRLAEAGYAMVDMETAAVAAALAPRAIPFLPLRVISDEAGDVLPTAALAASFDLEKQKPAVLPLLAHLLRHPSQIGPFATFVRHLGPARAALTQAVRSLLAA